MAGFSDNVTTNVAFLGDRAREMAADESDRSKVLDTKAAGVVAASVALTGAGASFAARRVRDRRRVRCVRQWDRPRVLEDDPTRVEGSLMRASVHSVGHARTVNNVKAGRLRWASIGLGAGLASIVVLAVSLAVHAVERA